MMSDQLILALSEHWIFGWKLNLYSAQTDPDNGAVRILGIPDAGEEERRGTADELIQLVKLADEISDRILMRDYSKKKSTVELKNEMTPELLEQCVRPRIENTNCRIVELAIQTGIPVYIRDDLSGHHLYERNRIQIVSQPAKCLFHFVKNERGLRYFISLTTGSRNVSLTGRRGVILSNKPSIVLIGKEVFCLKTIESKRLTPFFKKEYISVPAQSEEMYLRDFVLKTMQDYEVRIQGIPVREIVPEKQAFLSLETDSSREPLLRLFFQYHDTRVDPDSKAAKATYMDRSSGKTVICRYKRDRKWETALRNKLQQEGLSPKEACCFYLPAASSSPYPLIEWLNRKASVLLPDFRIEQRMDQNYFLGPVSLRSSFDTKTDWFDIHITVIAGGFQIPFVRFRKHILSGKNEYLLPDRTVFILPQAWFEKYGELFQHSRDCETGLRLKKIHALTLTQALEGEAPEEKLQQTVRFLQPPADPPALPPVSAVLRSYQKEGFYWLEHLYRNGFGGCLADDMGLGKTVQVITLLLHLYHYADRVPVYDLPASLVVVPTSLLHNWQNELNRFAPQLKVLLYAGDKRMRIKQVVEMFDRYHVVITSYGTLRNDVSCFRKHFFRLVVLDESQYIKNPESLSYRAVKQLVSRIRLALTGTPVENSLDDLWAQFNFINEGLLGSFASFRKKYIQPIVKEKNTQQEMKLKKIIAPFLLRRTKEEVTPELPPLLQEMIYCNMTEAQQAEYDAEKNRIRNRLLETPPFPSRSNSLIALEGLNRLRQIASHPKLVDPNYTGDAGKFDQIILSFESLQASKHKVLIFSSYVKHLLLLAERFDAEGWAYVMLTGRTQNREEVIRRFTDDEQIRCFFISLKAGGAGLNLTAADYVFVVDPWWNPAAEMQALSRAHRIGQDKPVIACRFISSETVEEKILRLQETKSALAETFIHTNHSFAQLNRDEIVALLE